MGVADAVATVAGHILARLRDDLTPAQETVLRRALHTEAERIHPARTYGAPGWTPGTPPTAASLEGATAMTIIQRHARELHAGDIITADPDHNDRPVRWRVSRPPVRTRDGEYALTNVVDLATGREHVTYYKALQSLDVEPVGGAR